MTKEISEQSEMHQFVEDQSYREGQKHHDPERRSTEQDGQENYQNKDPYQSSKERLKDMLRTMMSTIYYTPVETMLGTLYIAFRGGSGILKMVSLDDEKSFKHNFTQLFHQEPVLEADPPEKLLQHIQEAVSLHHPFPGYYDISQLPLLQQQMLTRIRLIPAGKVLTYTECARDIGHPDQAGKFEQFLQQNPLPIIIPCHRVVHDDGTPGSYVGEKTIIKCILLSHEGVTLAKKYEQQESSKKTHIIGKTLYNQAFSTYMGSYNKKERRIGNNAEAELLQGLLNWYIKKYSAIHIPQEIQDITHVKLETIYHPLYLHIGTRNEQLESNQPGQQEEQTGLHILDAIHRSQFLTLTGQVGAGKTTALRYIALRYAYKIKHELEWQHSTPNRNLVPIPLQLCSYVEHGLPRGESLRDFMVSYFTRFGCPEQGLAELLESYFNKGKCLILLDGLDEVNDIEQRQQLIEQINSIVHSEPGIHNHFIVTTCSISSARALSSKFTHYDIKGLETREIDQFVDRWQTVFMSRKATNQKERKEQEDKQKDNKEILQRLIRMTHESITHNNRTDRPTPLTPLLAQIIIIIYYTILQHEERSFELSKDEIQMVYIALTEYTRLPISTMKEFLTPHLSKIIYEYYVTKAMGPLLLERKESNIPIYLTHAQKDVYTVEKGACEIAQTPSSLYNFIDEISQALNKLPSKESSAQHKDYSLHKIQMNKQKLLLTLSRYTDQFIMPTHHILTP